MCSGDLQTTRPDCFAKTRHFYAEGSFGKYTGFLQPRDEAQERKKGKKRRGKKKRQTLAVPSSTSKNLSQPGEHGDCRSTSPCADKQQLPRSTGGPWEHMALLFLALHETLRGSLRAHLAQSRQRGAEEHVLLPHPEGACVLVQICFLCPLR